MESSVQNINMSKIDYKALAEKLPAEGILASQLQEFAGKDKTVIGKMLRLGKKQMSSSDVSFWTSGGNYSEDAFMTREDFKNACTRIKSHSIYYPPLEIQSEINATVERMLAGVTETERKDIKQALASECLKNGIIVDPLKLLKESGNNAAANYSSTKQRILMSDIFYTDPSILLHEVVHAMQDKYAQELGGSLKDLSILRTEAQATYKTTEFRIKNRMPDQSGCYDDPSAFAKIYNDGKKNGETLAEIIYKIQESECLNKLYPVIGKFWGDRRLPAIGGIDVNGSLTKLTCEAIGRIPGAETTHGKDFRKKEITVFKAPDGRIAVLRQDGYNKYDCKIAGGNKLPEWFNDEYEYFRLKLDYEAQKWVTARVAKYSEKYDSKKPPSLWQRISKWWN